VPHLDFVVLELREGVIRGRFLGIHRCYHWVHGHGRGRDRWVRQVPWRRQVGDRMCSNDHCLKSPIDVSSVQQWLCCCVNGGLLDLRIIHSSSPGSYYSNRTNRCIDEFIIVAQMN